MWSPVVVAPGSVCVVSSGGSTRFSVCGLSSGGSTRFSVCGLSSGDSVHTVDACTLPTCLVTLFYMDQ